MTANQMLKAQLFASKVDFIINNIFISILFIKIMIKMTELHWPGKTSPFVYRTKSVKKRGRPRRLDTLEESQKPRQVRPGLANWAKGNAAYLRMLEEFGVSDLGRDKIMTKYTAHHNIKILDKVHNQSQEEYGEQMNDGQLDDDEHKDSIKDRIVFLRLT